MQGEEKRVRLHQQWRTLRDFENDLKRRRSLLGRGMGVTLEEFVKDRR